MSRQVRILGIAPYEGLASLMEQYARKRSDMKLTAVTGSMEEGLAAARELYLNYDMIISRANTARLISRELPVTVIDMGIGYYDVLRCLKLAESTGTRFAFVGFQTLTSIARTLCDLLKTPVDIFSIHTYEEATALLDQLKENGYSTIICDTLPYDYAKKIGITPLLLTSSEESLAGAIDQAVYLWNQRSSIPASHTRSGISVTDCRSVIKSFSEDFCYNDTENLKKPIVNAARSNTRSCLMLVGETGTGKDHMAKVYYTESELRDNPFYMIDCAFIDERSWKFMIKSHNSPFTDENNTIYISNIEKLTPMQQKQLLVILKDTNVHIRNRLILSCIRLSDGSIPPVAKLYANTLNCILSTLKPLRELREEIPALAGQYLNLLNQSTGKVIVGFDDGALELLKNYDFPYNNIQFKRILKEAAIHTKDAYISKKMMEEMIGQEKNLFEPSEKYRPVSADSSSPFPVNLEQTLDEITRDIILYTLKNCNENQTAAARKLGIGRTTLWRYLKN